MRKLAAIAASFLIFTTAGNQYARAQDEYPSDQNEADDESVSTDEPVSTEAPAVTDAATSAELNGFYDALSPYGSWIYTEEYGWVWQPAGVGSDWAPYSYGTWIWTDNYGWYWNSYYEWGWAPFHYGRWALYPSFGWVWVPGTLWAPAWVMWRYSPDYIGWYPLAPGYIVDYNHWHRCRCQPEHWVFVKSSNFGRDDQNHFYIPANRNPGIISSTNESHQYVPRNGGHAYIAGPSKQQVAEFAGRTFEPVKLRNSSAPTRPAFYTGTGVVDIYRPHFSKPAQVLLPRQSISKLPQASRNLAAPAPVFNGVPTYHGARVPYPPQVQVSHPGFTPNKPSYQPRPPTPGYEGHKATYSGQRVYEPEKISNSGAAKANRPPMIEEEEGQTVKVKQYSRPSYSKPAPTYTPSHGKRE